MIEVILSAAVICFGGDCYPALIGKDTRPGEYQLQHVVTRQPGYGGDVLVYRDTGKYWYAIHRTWRGRAHLYNEPATKRRSVSLGCINVQPNVYDLLVTYSTGASPARLHIRES